MPFVIDKLVQITNLTFLAALKGPPILISNVLSQVKTLSGLLFIIALDSVLFVINCLTPQKPKGKVVAKGDPGYGGLWPEYREPDPSRDSRSPCPYLNALANHGVVNRSGRNIPLHDLRVAIQKTLNTSFTLTYGTTNAVKTIFNKDTIDLGDLSRHDVIEHDASALRADAYFQPDQGTPNRQLIISLLRSGSSISSSGSKQLSAQDVATFVNSRIADSRKNNPTFDPRGLSAFHTLFACNNLSLLLDAFDGDVKVLETFLLEERLPDGWETAFRGRLGHTNLEFELRSLEIWLRMH